eukprot:3442208-Lingulodinium_polyedra.AAC.1
MEEYEHMWGEVLQMLVLEFRVDASTLQAPLDSITTRPWNYGYLVGFAAVSHAPNGLPMLKVLAEGTTRWLLVDLASIAAYMRAAVKFEK